MAEYEQDDHLIDQFLTGNLTNEENDLFKERMQDTAFKKKLAFMQDLKEVVKVKTLNDLKSSLQEEEKRIQKSTLTRVTLMAVAAALLLFITIWATWPGSASTPDEYYAMYFSPYQNNLVPIEKSASSLTEEETVFRNYENGTYDIALSGFRQLLGQNDDSDIRFYMANTLLTLNQTDEAIQVLENLIEENQTQYGEQAKWFLALAYLKVNNLSNAKPLLEELSSDSFFSDEASQILKDLSFE